VSINGTANDFCNTLEANLDRPVVNETNLQGEFRFRVASPEGAVNEFHEQLREKLGLEITPATRSVELLILEMR
jgi:uncharacterized protein (TIGR03435 family)